MSFWTAFIILLLSFGDVHSAYTGEPATYLAGAGSGQLALFGGGSKVIDCSEQFLQNVLPFPGGSPVPPAQLIVGRCGLAAASSGAYILFAGGNSKLGYSASVDIYRNGSAWLPQNGVQLSLSQPRAWLQAAAGRRWVYFVGGAIPLGLSAAVDMFDTETAMMRPGPALREPRMFHSVAATTARSGGDVLWVAGGTNGAEVLSEVTVLRGGRKWSVNPTGLSAKKTRLAAATATCSDGKQLACFGGGEGIVDGGEGWECDRRGFCASRAVECFDNTGLRVFEGILSQARSRLAAVAVGPYVIFAGGRSASDGLGSTAVDVLNVCDSSAQARVSSDLVLCQGRADLAGAALGAGVVVFIGGNARGTVTDAADVFTIPGTRPVDYV